MKPLNFSLIFCALLAACLMSGAQAAGEKGQTLYKWVDKNGVVHYGQSVPPEYANQQLQVLNNQGVTVQTIAAPKTAEELAKEKQDKLEAAAKAKQLKEQHENDQMLLDTYTSVSDIERDRNSRLSAIDAQIKFINNSITGLQGALIGYKNQEDKFAKQHKPVPAYLQKDMQNTREQLETNQKYLLEQQQNEQQVKARYSGYIKRYQQLTGQNSPGGGN
ncbi:MAG: DUF4124 domain-containing protein [Gammaproteobacteria bacterium]|nr:DUF4124 domain-containing protein [Gammaproteobacteria bacterium]MDE2346743.1 DUF4124 domain-containing protein [Gammaproteobacteria bacterium]